MDTIKYLLGKIVKLVVFLFMLVFIIALANVIFPGFQFSKAINFSFFNRDWLPAPQNYSRGLVQPNADGTYGTLYQHGEPFNGYQTQPNRYVTYSYNGQQPVGSQPVFSGTTSTYEERMRYIRNVSFYEGSSITHGQTLYGEARSDMFRNGIFQIIIADRAGRPITSMYAMNVGEWSVPGWPRWKAVVPVKLPQNIDCVLVFVAGDGSRIAIPVRCN